MKNYQPFLTTLLSKKSSLGREKSKSHVLDANKSLWIAKSPSKTNTTDKEAWQFSSISRQATYTLLNLLAITVQYKS